MNAFPVIVAIALALAIIGCGDIQKTQEAKAKQNIREYGVECKALCQELGLDVRVKLGGMRSSAGASRPKPNYPPFQAVERARTRAGASDGAGAAPHGVYPGGEEGFGSGAPFSTQLQFAKTGLWDPSQKFIKRFSHPRIPPIPPQGEGAPNKRGNPVTHLPAELVTHGGKLRANLPP